jgi:hypothetical protein
MGTQVGRFVDRCNDMHLPHQRPHLERWRNFGEDISLQVLRFTFKFEPQGSDACRRMLDIELTLIQ